MRQEQVIEKALATLVIILLALTSCTADHPSLQTPMTPAKQQQIVEALLPVHRLSMDEKRELASDIEEGRYGNIDMQPFLTGRPLFSTNIQGVYTESPDPSDTLAFTAESRSWMVNSSPTTYGLIRISPSERYLVYYADIPSIGSLFYCEDIASEDYIIYLIEPDETDASFLIQENPDSYVFGPGNTSDLEAFLAADGLFYDLSLPENQGELLQITWTIDYIDQEGDAQTFQHVQDFGASDFGVFEVKASTADEGGLWLQPCQITTAQWTITGIWPDHALRGTSICPRTRQGEFPPSQPPCQSEACDFDGFRYVD